MVKWAGGYTPPVITPNPTTWEEHHRLWELRRHKREQHAKALRHMERPSELDTETNARLAVKAEVVNTKRPSAAEIAYQTPDVVHWLRAQMVAKHQLDDGTTSGGKPGSKPPFKIAFMNAADREVMVLAHWAQEVGLDLVGHFWKVRGVVAGVAPDVLDPVVDLSCELGDYLSSTANPEGVLDHPYFGLYTVRANHFGNWPQLAAAMSVPEADETVEEGLW